MARVQQLSVWLHGEHVAELRRTGPGRVSCRYTPATLDRLPAAVPLLSCSLPLQSRRQPAWPFVTGLLPEGAHRASMSRLAGVDSLDALGMLARFGRDVAGALIVTSRQDDPTGSAQPGLIPLTERDLLSEVESLPERSLGLHDDSELSLAGLQDKILLVQVDGGWARPVHGYPSTHILKVDNRVHRGTVVAEHDCLQLARSAGLAAAASVLTRVGDADCIIVERYDRTKTGDQVLRVHQEDSCQALGIDPAGATGRAKYEDHGGPSLTRIAELLNAFSPDPTAQLLRLLERVTFTVVIGDGDAHGKNISLLHPDPQHVTLAPLYDTVPTGLWPTLRPTAAMRVAGRNLLASITVEDLVAEARHWGLAAHRARACIADIRDRLAQATPELPDRPGRPLRAAVDTNLARLSGRG